MTDFKPAQPQAPSSKYPQPSYPPCILTMQGPSGALGVFNLGGGVYDNPFGGQLKGVNQVCTKARADAMAAVLAKATGLPLTARIDPAGQFAYLNANYPESVLLSAGADGVNIYTLWDTRAETNPKLAEVEPLGGNIQEYVVQEEEHGIGAPHRWVYDTAGGEFKNPQLRIVWD